MKQMPCMLWKGLFLQRQKACEPLEDILADRCVRGQYVLHPLAAQPLVSVVVRTHARPQVLAHTLRTGESPRQSIEYIHTSIITRELL